jgi:hypothetical protein
MRKNLRYLLLIAAITCLWATNLAAQQSGESMLQPKHYGNIPYISGGIGLDEREALNSLAAGYDLKLMFAVSAGNYLADVRVEIRDASGQLLLDAVSEGPWFFTHLPPGHYNVSVSLAGSVQRQDVHVSGRGRSQLNFFWK